MRKANAGFLPPVRGRLSSNRRVDVGNMISPPPHDGGNPPGGFFVFSGQSAACPVSWRKNQVRSAVSETTSSPYIPKVLMGLPEAAASWPHEPRVAVTMMCCLPLTRSVKLAGPSSPPVVFGLCDRLFASAIAIHRGSILSRPCSISLGTARTTCVAVSPTKLICHCSAILVSSRKLITRARYGGSWYCEQCSSPCRAAIGPARTGSRD